MNEEKPAFGILDLLPKDVRSPPEFTESATLAAMLQLGVEPLDLVCPEFRPGHDPDQFIAIELEKRRIETFQQIISERGRILDDPPIDISRFLPKAPPVRSRPRKTRLRKPRKRSSPHGEGMPCVLPEKDLIIRQRALERMSAVMHEQSQMKMKKEQRKQAVRRMQLQEERRLQKRREQKMLQYEREKKKRMAHFDVKLVRRARVNTEEMEE
jgi:hypothetical protein